ncbi:zinc-ribbon domain-containing protein [Microbacterium sp.]|uniref:zinc-ribbon domain-containing protein n=1 Tax=Microbacterium sp. TaxID=51671 RepID=UPI003A8FE398
MTDQLAWAIRPKWHRYESTRSYTRRQCEAVGIPLDYAERGLTTPTRPYINKVWADDGAAAAVVEAAAGRPAGHYERLKRRAQPDHGLTYPERFLCRLCAAGERVEQIPHDRENWCLRHPGQLVWAGPGTTPGTQPVLPYDRDQAKAERTFRRLVAAGRVDAVLHARVWEMVRDNAWITQPEGWTPVLGQFPDDHEVRGRAALYPETVAVLEVLCDPTNLDRWRTRRPDELRADIVATLPPAPGPVDVLVERIVLWLRPLRRETRPTRVDPLNVPLDTVDAAAIIDISAPYPTWIQRHPRAVAEWDWSCNDPARDPWNPAGVSRKAWWVCDQGHSWEARPMVRGQAVAGCPYCSGHSVWPGHTDLATVHPALAAEWDHEPGANAGDPDHIGASSHRRVAWVCLSGHRWIASVNNRASRGTGCPVCVNFTVLPGHNDLTTTHPELAAQWHVSNAKTAQDVTAGSAYRATWECGEGHQWERPVSEEARRSGCPFCSGRCVLDGFNDLATVSPALAAEWDTTAGVNDRKPSDVTRRSQYRAGWRCARGHTWRSTVTTRAAGHGCPSCAKSPPVPAGKDLAALRPDLAVEWDRSNDLKPDQVFAFSNKTFTWRCTKGHVWEAKVSNRSKGCGCPYCAGKRVIPGENDLATFRPDLAVEWDRSNDLKPDQVAPFSNKKATWRCMKGHTWRAIIANRAKGRGCPHCAKRRTVHGDGSRLVRSDR